MSAHRILAALLILSACDLKEDLPDRIALTPHPDGLLFQDVRLFAATGPDAAEHMDVLVRDGLIAAISPTGSPAPEGVTVVSGDGRTLLPGLIDAHVHVLGSEAPPWDLFLVPGEDHLQAWLAGGVTTVVDMGSEPSDLMKLRDEVRSGAIPGPRIYMAGSSPVTVSGGHPIPALRELLPGILAGAVTRSVWTVDAPEEAAERVAAMLEYQPDHVKVIYDAIPDGSPQMRRETLAAMVQAAHDNDLPIAVHVGTPQDMRDAAEAGADIFAHGVYQGTLTDADAAAIAATGSPVVFTAWAFEATALTGEGALTATDLDTRLAPQRALTPALGSSGAGVLETVVMGEMARTCSENRQARRDNLKKLHDAGATILAGSDSPFLGIWPGSSLHNDLAELVASGLPPAEALLGATARSAAMLEESPDFGTVQIGKVADLLLVSGDPLSDITATQDIVMILQAGTEVTEK